MGIYTSAEIRYGVVIPEDVDEEQVEKLVEDVDGLEVTSFGEYEWGDDLPTWALVLVEPKVSAGEYAIQKFAGHELSVPAKPGGMDEAQNAGQKIARDLWDGNWIADVGYLLVWSRG